MSISTRALQPYLDVAVPAVLAVLTVIQLVTSPPPGNLTLITVFGLGSVLPLAARRRVPFIVTAVVGVSVAGQVLATHGASPTFGSFLATMICVYTLAREARPVPTVGGLLVLAAAVTATAVLGTAPVDFFGVLIPLVYFGVAGGLGALVRQRALRLVAVEDRAQALENQLEREAELAAAQERARIARELHDVVAHGLSLMVVQAEAAEEILAHDPDAVAGPLHRIQETGRQSLGEMRRLLGVLRGSETGEPTAPQPSLSRLPELTDEASAGGLPVEVHVDGEERELPLGVQLTAYRIVQEALTNARRHAAARSAVVRLSYDTDALRIEVSDDGRGPTGGRPGHGLIGMRERAALYGGTLTAGAGPSGGFSVSARLPLDHADVRVPEPAHE
jgi:signal transduction histidine kinase